MIITDENEGKKSMILSCVKYIIYLFLLGVFLTGKSYADNKNLIVEYSKNNRGNFDGTLVNGSRELYKINKIIINGRSGDPLCVLNGSAPGSGDSLGFIAYFTRSDTSGETRNFELNTGDRISFTSSRSCGDIIFLEVHTDKGVFEY